MAFTTLEQRFNQVSAQIYSRYAASGDQLVRIAPNTNGVFGSKSRVKSDSRLLPLVSTVRDIRRISAFLTSPAGVLFIGKQFLLQTGNTFEETRFYNPLSALINTDPFLGRKSARHVDLTQPFNVKTPTREFRGGLQTETVSKFTSTNDNLTLFDRIKSQARSVTSALFNPTNNTANYYVRPEDELFYKISQVELYWNRFGNFSVYQGTDSTITGTRRYGVQSRVSRGSKSKPATNNIDPSKDTVPATFREQFIKFGTQRIDRVRGSKTFKELENSLQTNGYFIGAPLDAQNIGPDIDNAQRIKQNVPGTNFKYPTVLDPYNGREGEAREATSTVINGTQVAVQTEVNATSRFTMYSDIEFNPKEVIDEYANTSKTDIIKFIFRRAANDAVPVHFRAFLSSLKENVKPDFSEQRYIGRTERFVTYGGAKRQANFEFNIVSFGSTETDRIWERINYLTGLAFPVKASANGFMVPPLFKLTIGGIYEEQPCYIETLDYDFLDSSITFDIDKEVSQAVNVKMNVVLLEKRSKFYDSPFYAITEEREKLVERLNRAAATRNSTST